MLLHLLYGNPLLGRKKINGEVFAAKTIVQNFEQHPDHSALKTCHHLLWGKFCLVGF